MESTIEWITWRYRFLEIVSMIFKLIFSIATMVFSIPAEAWKASGETFIQMMRKLLNSI